MVDATKAAASQLIVLHHLSFYGPMSDRARLLAPAVFDWLDTHARLAVQAFLVIGGFLAARSLAPEGLPGAVNPLRSVLRRVGKTLPVYLATVALAVATSGLARAWMTHDSIPAPPTVSHS